MEIIKGIEIVDLALHLKNEDILVMSDLHIGYEESLVKQGILVPKVHFKDLVDRVEKIFEIVGKVKVIVINGDLKHEFGTISDEEWRNTLKMIDYLSRKCERIVLVQGNHDKILGPIAKKRKVELVESFLDGDVMIVHGDKIVDAPSSVKTLIIGHEHPAVAVHDNLRKETYKCFLVGKWKRKKLVVMPSMNPLTPGTDVVSEKLLSPYLRQDLSKFDVYLVEDKVYAFGKLGKIPK